MTRLSFLGNNEHGIHQIQSSYVACCRLFFWLSGVQILRISFTMSTICCSGNHTPTGACYMMRNYLCNGVLRICDNYSSNISNLTRKIILSFILLQVLFSPKLTMIIRKDLRLQSRSSMCKMIKQQAFLKRG